MSKTKLFLHIFAVAVVFTFINYPNVFTKTGQAGANCAVLALLTTMMMGDFSRTKRRRKSYKEPAIYLVPALFLIALFVGILTGTPSVNLICYVIAFIIGAFTFFRKK